MPEEKQPGPSPVLLSFIWLLLLTFFGGGAILFANAFGHFLSESAFAIVALVVMADLAVLLIAGVFVRVIGWHRAIREAAKKSGNSD